MPRGRCRSRTSLARLLALLTLSGGPEFRAPFAWLPEALGILGAGGVAAAAANLLDPLRPRFVSEALERRRAAGLVRRHGNTR